MAFTTRLIEREDVARAVIALLIFSVVTVTCSSFRGMPLLVFVQHLVAGFVCLVSLMHTSSTGTSSKPQQLSSQSHSLQMVQTMTETKHGIVRNFILSRKLALLASYLALISLGFRTASFPHLQESYHTCTDSGTKLSCANKKHLFGANNICLTDEGESKFQKMKRRIMSIARKFGQSQKDIRKDKRAARKKKREDIESAVSQRVEIEIAKSNEMRRQAALFKFETEMRALATAKQKQRENIARDKERKYVSKQRMIRVLKVALDKSRRKFQERQEKMTLMVREKEGEITKIRTEAEERLNALNLALKRKEDEIAFLRKQAKISDSCPRRLEFLKTFLKTIISKESDKRESKLAAITALLEDKEANLRATLESREEDILGVRAKAEGAQQKLEAELKKTESELLVQSELRAQAEERERLAIEAASNVKRQLDRKYTLRRLGQLLFYSKDHEDVLGTSSRVVNDALEEIWTKPRKLNWLR